MRVSMLAVALGLCATAAYAQTPAPAAPALPEGTGRAHSPAAATATTTLTLGEAIVIAERANATVRAREAQLAVGEGLRREASSFFINNPELAAEQARRRGGPDGNISDRTVGVSQAFEIGGQQGRRREAAAATIEALRLELADARRQARADATLRFHGVLAAQRRVRIEERAVQLFEATSRAVSRRRAAGEDTRLDANVALIEAERARNALAVAREQLLAARAELATVLQLPAVQLPSVAEAPPGAGVASSFDLDELLMSVQSLPRVRALVAREAAARARLALEQGRRLPDVTVGLSVGRGMAPAAREKVTTLSVAIPLPLFNRNSAAIGQATADVGSAEVERSSAIRDSEATVRTLWLRLSSQRERVQRLQQAMVAAALDNQQLAGRSRQAGQIGLLDQLVVNRQALDAERELVEAQTELDNTRIEIERAAGWPQEGQTR